MKRNYNNENPIVIKSLTFAVEIVKFTDILSENRKWKIAEQLLKSGTSIGANIREAQSAESKVDFIHKMKISAKEIEETQYWLELIDEAYEEYDVEKYMADLKEIAKIVNAIITTSKKSLRK
jgi:four helix bundle protein